MADGRIDSGVDLDANVSQFIRQIDRAIRVARDFDSQLDLLERHGNINIGVQIDDANVSTIIGDLSNIDNVNVRLNITGDDEVTDLAGDLDRLDSESINIRANVDDSEVTDLSGRIDRIDGENANIKANVDDAELDDAEEQVERLDGKTIQLTLDVGDLASGALGAIGSGASFALDISGIGGIVEMDTALARLEARTGGLIPEAETLINDIFTGGWGESRTQIAEVLALAQQIGVPIEQLGATVETAFGVAAVTGEDVNEVLRTMENLSRNELVDSYGQAVDAIVGGFQNGLNIGDDFLDTLNEYGSTFNDMGLNIDDVLGVLNSGLDAGIDNTDRVADAMREFNIRTQEGTEAVQESVANLNLQDEFANLQSGDITTGDFLTDVITNLAELDETLQSSTAVELFGTQFEDFSVDTFIEALSNANDSIIEIEGSADKASTAISSDLGSAVDRLERIVTTGVGDALDSRFDITGFVDESSDALTTFFDQLQSGEEFNVAFQASFEGTRMGEIIQTLQNTLSDFIFSFLNGIRSAIDAIPGASTSSIDNTIANLGAVDFELDLATALDDDDVSTAVQQAIDRGVAEAEVLEALTERLDTAQAEGDLVEVYSLLQDINSLGFSELEVVPTGDTFGLTPQGFEDFEATGATVGSVEPGDFLGDVLNSQQLTEQIETDIIQAFDNAILNGNVQDAIDLAPLVDGITGDGMAVPLAEEMQTALEGSLETAINNMDIDLANTIAGQLGDNVPQDLVDAQAQLEEYLDLTGDVETTVSSDEIQATSDTTTGAITDIGNTSTDVAPEVDDLTASTQDLATAMGDVDAESVDALRTSLAGLGAIADEELGTLVTQAENAYTALQQLQDLQIDININVQGEGAQYVTGASATAGGGGSASTEVQNDISAGIP